MTTNFRAASLSAMVALLFLAGCATGQGRKTSAPSFDRIIAAGTKEHPRQSEGDIIVLKDGTLLAAWSDFAGRADHSQGQISASISGDGGISWNAPFVLQENKSKMNVMSVSFLRLRSGEILFFYLAKNSLSDLKVLVRRSSDEAKTWTEPVIVTPRNGYHIMNNARVIQLRSGRILCPVSFCEDIGQPSAHLRNLVFYSDDQGKTWDPSHGFIDVPQRGAMEPGLVQLKNGDVLQIIRTQFGQIWSCKSHDDGESWSSAAPYGIVSPESPATIKRLPDKHDLLLIYNPSTNASISKMSARTPLAAAISRDEGKTWSTPRLIETDPNFSYAYTSVTFDEHRALLTYYYAPYGTGQLSLKFKSIPLDWFREEEVASKTGN
ncbi:MAG: hypothetical protein JWM68_380 [Verrucomicrobiales bacterium]|nr:hypothetical protein [Verrucomicrobiales bacterium]